MTTAAIALLLVAAQGVTVAESWPRLRAEWPDVAANGGLRGVGFQRHPRDRRGVQLIFRWRSATAELEARRSGALACAEHWAAERGWRLTTRAV